MRSRQGDMNMTSAGMSCLGPQNAAALAASCVTGENYLYYNAQMSSNLGNGLSIMSPNRVFEAIEVLGAGDTPAFNLALGIILQKTSDQEGEMVWLERYTSMLPVLLKILDTANPLKNMFIKNLLAVFRNSGQVLPHDSDEGRLLYAVDLLSANKSSESWPEHEMPCVNDEVFKNLARTLDSSRVLLSVLTVLRNLSFDTNNCIIMAYSTNLVVHMISIITTMRTNGSVGEACGMALDIMGNIGHRVDMVGSRRAAHALHSEAIAFHHATRGAATAPKPSVGNLFVVPSLPAVDPATVPRGPPTSCLETAEDSFLYNVSTKCLLAMLCDLVSSSERSIVGHSLELMAQLALVPENAAVLNCMPAAVVRVVVNLYSASTASSDPLCLFTGSEVYNPYPTTAGSSSNTHRPPPPAVSLDYFQSFSDAGLRDLTLATLHSLCQHAVALRERIGAVPNFIAALIRFIESESAAYASLHRREANHPRLNVLRQAQLLLSSLASHPGNRDRVRAHEQQLCALAFTDDVLADILCSHAKSFVSPAVGVEAAVLEAVE